MQEQSKLGAHCLATEYEAKARAYYENILPNLPYKVDPADAMDTIIEMMPIELGSDQRRLRDKFVLAGVTDNYHYIMSECREVVFAD